MSPGPSVNVRRMALIRQPMPRVWTALRDELPAVGRRMDGIESIRRLERTADGDGIVHTTHEWRAAAALPPALERHLDAGALTWVERSRWDELALESRWTVESRLLARGLAGSGLTRLGPAMGGRGTRVQLDVSTTLEPGALGPSDREQYVVVNQ